MKPLILIGGGGHCKSVIEAARSAGFEIAGILDTPDRVGSCVLDCPVIGTDDDLSRYALDFQFVITVGHLKNSSVRQRIAADVIRGGDLQPLSLLRPA